MKRFTAVGTVFLAVSSLGHLTAQTANPSNDRAEIVRLSQELTDALARARHQADAARQIEHGWQDTQP